MYQDDLLAGQTLLVTGGGTGLGRSMAERFASLGAKIGIFGRRPDPLAETAGAIRGAGGEAAFTTCDIRDPEAVDAAIETLEGELGPFTGLVNNAAGNFLAPSEDLSRNAFDAVMQIVLYGTFHTTQALGRRWIGREQPAHVLSILTTYAWMGSPFVLPSACAKAGVLAMTRSLAVEWACYGIRFNGIAPGPFPTEGAFSRLMAGPLEEQAKQKIPLGRFGEHHELTDLAAYLFSPNAAYITGEVVTIDGGEWLANGQEFGHYARIPRQQMKDTLAAMKPKKK